MKQLFTYRLSRIGRPFFLALFAFLCLAGLASVFAMFADESVPGLGAALWGLALTFVLAWNGYWWMLRISQETTFDGTTLTWQAVMRGDSHSVNEIAGIGSFMVMLVTIEIEDERPVLLLPRKGVQEFVDQVAAARPDIPGARLNWYARANSKQPRRSRLTVTQ